MNIEVKAVTIRELVENYASTDTGGVVAYGGNLDVRPAYQREFIYNTKQQEAVIRTVKAGYPLNTMYWVNAGDGKFEVLDGQQRTLSICEYVNGAYSMDFKFFHNLTDDEKAALLDYELQIYTCTGNATAKLEWFRVINIAGMKLTDQELRNAVYSGEWLSDAKARFSKRNGPAENQAKEYLRGSAIRQNYLETAISWAANETIEDYMAENQHKHSAEPLWRHFQNVISWVKATFPVHRREMKGVNWGPLYAEYSGYDLDPTELEKEIVRLIMNDDVTRKRGIYSYVLTGNEKHLNIRAFTPSQKQAAYERQHGECLHCYQHFDLNDMEGDHITPWSEGGKTNANNLQMLCKSCNRTKSNK